MTQPLPDALQGFVTDGQTVNFVDQTGAVVGVPASQMSLAADQGLRPETPQEAEQRRYRRDAGFGEGALAALEGTASGATLGMSDVLAGGLLGPEYGQEALRRQQEFSDAYIGGQIAGGLAPALFSGGTTAGAQGGGLAARLAAGAGRAATTPAALAIRAGEGLGALAERAIVREGASGARQALSTAARMGTEAAVESSIASVGMQLGHAALADEELDLQTILATAGEDTLLGGIIGAGIGAGMRGAGAVARRASPMLESYGLGGADSAIRRLGDRQTIKGYTDATAVDLRRLYGADPNAARQRIATRLRETFGHDLDVRDLPTKREAIGRQLEVAGQDLDDVVTRAEADGARVDPQALWSELDQQLLGRLRAGAGVDREVADAVERGYLDVIRDTAVPQVSKEARRTIADAERQASVIARRADKAAQKLEARAAKMGDAPTQAQRAVLDKEQAAIDRMRQQANDAAQRAEDLRAATEVPRQELTLRDLRKLRARIDKDASFDPTGQFSGRNEALKEARAIIERKIDEAIGQTSPATQAAYREAKSAWGDWKGLDTIVGKRTGMIEGNRDISITDVIAAGGGVAQSGALGGLVAGAANRIFRSSAASAVQGRFLDKVTAAARARKAAQDGSKRITEAAASAVAGRLLRRLPKAINSRAIAAYDDIRERAERLEREQEAVVAELSARAAPLEALGGSVAGKYVAHQVRVARYLAAALPKPPAGMGTLGAPKPLPPPSEMAKWRAKAKAATEPMTTLGDLEDGTLTPEAVEALEVTQPRLLQTMRAEVEDQLRRQVDDGRAPSYQALQQLALFLGHPVDATQTPEFRAAQEQTTAVLLAQEAEAKAAANQVRASSLGPSRMSERLETPAERSEV